MSHSVKGFTLIEFLVASMLAMIVIVAASGTYMITRKLNTNAQERISVQQDIRNASVQMARDARMAGSFGCFNTGANKVPGKVISRIDAKHPDVKGLVFLGPDNPATDDEKDAFGVRVIPQNILESFPGLSGASDGLMFIYGQSATATHVPVADLSTNANVESTITAFEKVMLNDESDALKRALENNGDVVLSTCSAIASVEKINGFANTKANIDPVKISVINTQAGELNLSKMHASLYVLGDINRSGKQWDDEKALLRYDLGADGSWQNPQLLASGIKNMSFAFGYVNSGSCKNEITSATNSEVFSFFDSPKNDMKAPPALVQIRLKYYTNKATNDAANTAVERDYIINTTVRAGNTCANRLITS